jgi:2-dehydro-3-deoxyphosphogluconate aldolase / (4S)-4-hydroxy-2-oxoglutarate aldolase
MNADETQRRIVEIGIVPVLRASSAEQALRAIEAVREGGVPIIEVTMTVPGAIGLISRLARDMSSDLLIGAGTVLDAGVARQCIEAGAEFVVSPGLDLATVEQVKQSGKVAISGALTPTEVIMAWKAGSHFVKIFPCGVVGGAKYIKALKGPLPQVRMIPTGGVSLDTVSDLIRAGAEALGVGGEIISQAALDSGETAAISDAAQRFLNAVQQARGARRPSVSA